MSVNTSTITFGGAPRVNLMPRAETDRRERSALLRRWGWGIVAALLLVVAVSAGVYAIQWTADQTLAAENARTTQLLTDLAAHADIRAALDLESELSDFRVDAMASDLDWPAAVAELAGVLPDDVTISGFDLTVGPVPAGEDRAVEVGLIGTFALSASSPMDIVPLIRDTRDLESVINADGPQLNSGGDESTSYTYTLAVAFDQSLYTGDYAEEEAE
ncbi:hypothetical protein [Microbacterium terricola]|uniref:Tfp pilus assembly protein PilN n=1 Tax=Microbacterium terricola TaxID=344163 RepID=A0ABM8DXJ5_9MICO|nr:hypothetical protein [Microbacterium terricola]UYK38943.1 hypothetical protein OAU46_09505 [Microbacterium terricola]BDV30357.1 hypothetical protein Microterr_10170 [Microbacterium terricola]